MSIKTCKQHANEPIFIYAQCAGCEIQRYRDEVKQLKAENERLERNRDMWKGQVERQAEELTSLRKDAERYRRIKLDASMDGSLIERLDCNVPVKLWDSSIDREMAK